MCSKIWNDTLLRLQQPFYPTSSGIESAGCLGFHHHFQEFPHRHKPVLLFRLVAFLDPLGHNELYLACRILSVLAIEIPGSSVARCLCSIRSASDRICDQRSLQEDLAASMVNRVTGKTSSKYSSFPGNIKFIDRKREWKIQYFQSTMRNDELGLRAVSLRYSTSDVSAKSGLDYVSSRELWFSRREARGSGGYKSTRRPGTGGGTAIILYFLPTPPRSKIQFMLNGHLPGFALPKYFAARIYRCQRAPRAFAR